MAATTLDGVVYWAEGGPGGMVIVRSAALKAGPSSALAQFVSSMTINAIAVTNSTVFLSAVPAQVRSFHDRDLAFGVADRIAVIHEGNILAIGPPEEVKRNPNPLIKRFLNADFKRPTQ